MVDMFTLVLLFLLMFYDPLYDGSSPIQLPAARVQTANEGAVGVRVTRESIEVDGKKVLSSGEGAPPPVAGSSGRAIPALVQALMPLVPKGADPVPAIVVECDKRVSWEVLGAVLESAAEAGFPRYRFVVAGE